MLPEEDLPPERREEQRQVSTGGAPLKSTQEAPPSHDHVSGGNALPDDSINSPAQPLPAAAPAGGEASPDAVTFKKPLQEQQKSTCGLTAPDNEVPPPYPGLEQQQGSRPVVHSRKSRSSRSKVAASQQPAASAADCCLQLLLACLSCQGSVLLLGLGEACSSCLHALCSPCCHACAVCCSALQEAPVEELSCHAHCHRVLFGSCCEPIECLEFCLECCEICHRG
ncbi:uncharacterized protein LOC130536752 isoform X1 [Takifugu flavidus]|uniref:uncharacterized protein LOC130536752 isoform X1 n=1 Tax=Takifugu flavidus TaxID=433684 RepID=UPI002544393D|nr:uncharacterized protein LOC130536752 isoform X1 [Takifugu flavidus]